MSGSRPWESTTPMAVRRHCRSIRYRGHSLFISIPPVESRPVSRLSQRRLLLGISCLEGLSVLLEIETWFRLVTYCAVVFLCGLYRILYSLIFQMPHFKKLSGYPVENNGGVFCGSCRRDSIPAVTGLRGPSDCIDGEVATEFRHLPLPTLFLCRRSSGSRHRQRELRQFQHFQ